ncbi:MAG: response regulator, partial [Planctomyces sp.]
MARNSSGSLLVVDDDRHIQSAMAEYLRGLGHRTETASSCLEALERMEEFPFEVVICDVNLQDKDG